MENLFNIFTFPEFIFLVLLDVGLGVVVISTLSKHFIQIFLTHHREQWGGSFAWGFEACQNTFSLEAGSAFCSLKNKMAYIFMICYFLGKGHRSIEVLLLGPCEALVEPYLPAHCWYCRASVLLERRGDLSHSPSCTPTRWNGPGKKDITYYRAPCLKCKALSTPAASTIRSFPKSIYKKWPKCFTIQVR